MNLSTLNLPDLSAHTLLYSVRRRVSVLMSVCAPYASSLLCACSRQMFEAMQILSWKETSISCHLCSITVALYVAKQHCPAALHPLGGKHVSEINQACLLFSQSKRLFIRHRCSNANLRFATLAVLWCICSVIAVAVLIHKPVSLFHLALWSSSVLTFSWCFYNPAWLWSQQDNC